MTTVELPAQPDAAAVEAFGDRMVGILNEACTALMTSIGHQTGLFEALAERSPATSDEVAAVAALDARYVREWLNAMTTARILDYEPESRSDPLPAEHAAWLTEAAGPDNLASAMMFLSMLAEVEQGIGLLPLRRWRAVRRVPAFPHADGRGQPGVRDVALFEVSRWCPGCRSGSRGHRRRRHRMRERSRDQPAGAGFPRAASRASTSPRRCRCCRREARALGLKNARFDERDVSDLGVAEAFDLITAFDAIHDQAQPASARGDREGASFRRGVPDGRHQGIESRPREHGPPVGAVPLHGVDDALHDRVTRTRRRGPRDVLGSQVATEMLNDAGFSHVEIPDDRARPVQQLLRLPAQLTTPDDHWPWLRRRRLRSRRRRSHRRRRSYRRRRSHRSRHRHSRRP